MTPDTARKQFADAMGELEEGEAGKGGVMFCHEHAAAPAGQRPSWSESPATLTAATDTPLPVRRAAARGATGPRAAARGAARPGAGARAAARAGAAAAAGAGTRPARPPRFPLHNIVAGVILLIHFWR